MMMTVIILASTVALAGAALAQPTKPPPTRAQATDVLTQDSLLDKRIETPRNVVRPNKSTKRGASK